MKNKKINGFLALRCEAAGVISFRKYSHLNLTLLLSLPTLPLRLSHNCQLHKLLHKNSSENCFENLFSVQLHNLAIQKLF